MSTTIERFDGAPAGAPATAAACIVGSLKLGFVRAAAKLAALSNRSAANFSNDFVAAADTFAGTDLRNSVTGLASYFDMYNNNML